MADKKHSDQKILTERDEKSHPLARNTEPIEEGKQPAQNPRGIGHLEEEKQNPPLKHA